MKKTFIAASMLGIFATGAVSAAQSTETVNVTFVGEVKDLACTIQVGGANNTINLGMLDAKANAEGKIVPVMFRFSDCNTGTKLASIVLSGGQNAGAPEEQIDQGTLGTDKKNVTVQLMTDTAGNFDKKPVTFSDVALPEENSGNTFAVTPYYAQLKAGAANPELGKVSSVGVFTIEYK